MPRVVDITLPSANSGDLLARVRDFPGLISLRMQAQASLQPPGDVMTLTLTNDALPGLLEELDKMGLMRDPQVSITTSQPSSLISASAPKTIRADSGYAIWEEVDQQLHDESNMTVGSVIVMAIAGAIATIGIMNNTLHVVIGAMVIAPGFEPLTRFSLGVLHRAPTWKSGAADTAKGYAALIAGALLAALALQQWGYSPANTHGSYLPTGVLIEYWTTITGASLCSSAIAAAAGTFLILQQRSVLTAGVMIALALIPSATVIGIGIAFADAGMVATGLMRLGLEMLLVLSISMLVFAWKFKWKDKRRLSG